MTITPTLFEAFLKCPTKCWLRFIGKSATENVYSKWLQTKQESYCANTAKILFTDAPVGECIQAASSENLKKGRWSLALDVIVKTQFCYSHQKELATNNLQPPKLATTSIESCLPAIERIPAEGRGRTTQYIPMRFVFKNKLIEEHKLLLAFDMLVLSKVLRRKVSLGKIIYGDKYATRRFKLSTLTENVQKCCNEIAILLSSCTPPEIALNRHCPECEFESYCRQDALKQDDLSLLANMTAKERQKLRSKGIFTVTQLSYTFRPRRRPKKLRDRQEKYHHSLKARAIREKKIHIVGKPELKIDGTPVYLDVEGLPDRDFYYLIGMRIANRKSASQHSFWADTFQDEEVIWRNFLSVLKSVEKPVLIHYGNYETDFLRKMNGRYSSSNEPIANSTTINVLKEIFSRVYFPTYSNSLKDIGAWLGISWSHLLPSGIYSIAYRYEWEISRDPLKKSELINYNLQDCIGVEKVTDALLLLGATAPFQKEYPNIVNVEEIRTRDRKLGPLVSPIKEFEKLSHAAWWDYQRNRIYIRSDKRNNFISSRSIQRRASVRNPRRIDKIISHCAPTNCPRCGGEHLKPSKRHNRIVHDIAFGKHLVKRRIAKHEFRYFYCTTCRNRFGEPLTIWPLSHFGRNFVAFLLSQIIELEIPIVKVGEMLRRYFKMDISASTLLSIKNSAGKYYWETANSILQHLSNSNLINADETHLSVRGKKAYVWIFTNRNDVVYLYSDSREGSLVQNLAKDFKGALVSDFYKVYDSADCMQQKCLVHLMRDLNDYVLRHTYDGVLMTIVTNFATLLMEIVRTIDKWGLKRRFLRKHHVDVHRLYRKLSRLECKSEITIQCRQRFNKYRDRLFTFLDHDNIPWNNNNAEHAVRAFVRLRNIVRGSFTEDSAKNYLVLLSICQTCKNYGLSFFDFISSGEKDIYVFAQNLGRRKLQVQECETFI